MYKVIKSGDVFKIKQIDEKGNSGPIDERNFPTAEAANAEVSRMQSEADTQKANDTQEAPTKAPESAPTAPANEPQTDNPAARGAVDEGQAPAAPAAGDGAAAPSDAGDVAPPQGTGEAPQI